MVEVSPRSGPISIRYWSWLLLLLLLLAAGIWYFYPRASSWEKVKAASIVPNFTAFRSDPANPMRVTLGLAGIPDPRTRQPLIITKSNLTVYEDGAKKDIEIEPAGTLKVKTDIVFFIDITSSMRSAIDGVKASVLDFLKYLQGKGLDVQIGAVAYGDGFPSGSNPAGIPAGERGAMVVADYSSMSADIGAGGSVYSFINALGASYRGSHGGDVPEGLFDALEWARKSFVFRGEANKLFIVITDAPSWGEGATTHEIAAGSTFTTRSLAESYSGQITVDVISPDGLYTGGGAYDPLFLAVAGPDSPGTGGVWDPLPRDGKINLNTLLLRNVAAAGVLVTYLSASPPTGDHQVRVVIDDTPSGAKGESTRNLRY